MHFQWISPAFVARFREVLPGVVMLLFCQLLLLGFAVPYCKASSHQRAIFILYSNEYELPANQLISRGLQKGLRDSAMVTTFTEFLDATRFPERYQDGSLARFIHEKYAGQKFDLLIAVGPRAVDFARSERDSLAPGVPIIFAGVGADDPETAGLPNSTGILSKYDLLKSIELAKTLQPNALDIVVITGTSAFDRDWEETAREKLQTLSGQFRINFLAGLPVAELLERLRKIDRSTIVLYLSIFTDGAGEEFLPRDVAGKIAEASPAPVYSVYDSYLGTGVIGGYVDRFEIVGRETAHLAIRVLKGEVPSRITPYIGSTHRFVVDGTVMERWSLDMGALPEGTEIENWEPPVWQKYFWQLLLTGAAFAAQTLFLIKLRNEVSRRRSAERTSLQLQDRMEFASDAANLGMWEWDKATGAFWTSDTCRKVLGLQPNAIVTFEELTQNLNDKDSRLLHERFATLQKHGEPFVHRCETADLPGRTRWFKFEGGKHSTSSGAVRFTGTILDISREHESEVVKERQRSELAHLSRVSALGTLSGALAHELNQPLTAILANAQAGLTLIARKSRKPKVIAEILRDIVEDNKRAGHVIQNLRSLLKRDDAKKIEVDLNKLVTDTLVLAHSSTVQQRVQVETSLAPGLPPILGDPVQFQQVVLNLVMNACDAMTGVPENGRQLAIKTERLASGHIRTTVADSGPGVPIDGGIAVFEPFYSTKIAGLGLGLSICRDIISAFGGTIRAENRPEGGAIFSFDLPLVERAGP